MMLYESYHIWRVSGRTARRIKYADGSVSEEHTFLSPETAYAFVKIAEKLEPYDLLLSRSTITNTGYVSQGIGYGIMTSTSSFFEVPYKGEYKKIIEWDKNETTIHLGLILKIWFVGGISRLFAPLVKIGNKIWNGW